MLDGNNDDRNPPRGLDEQYIAATNASDLTLDPDHLCAVDHLIAAAIGGNRMGDALNHLRAEWGAAPKPAKWTEADVIARAEQLPKRKKKLDLNMARGQLIVEYATSMRAVYMRLAGRAKCMEILLEWAVRRDIDPDLLSPSLYHWLAPACPVCDGLGKRCRPGTPVLDKDCPHCAGTGKWPRPLGADRVEAFLKGCVGKAKSHRGEVLHGEIDLQDLAERKEAAKQVAPEDERGASAVAEVARLSMGSRR